MSNPFPFPIQFNDAGMRQGRRCIVLTKPLVAKTSLGCVEAPAGTISNGASIPKAFWSIVGSPFDEYLNESVIHDFLYSPANKEFTRSESDFIFKELMWNTGVAKWKIFAFYTALRLAGRANYQGQPQ